MRSSGAEKVFFGYGRPLLSLGSQLDFLIFVPGERFERYVVCTAVCDAVSNTMSLYCGSSSHMRNEAMNVFRCVKRVRSHGGRVG